MLECMRSDEHASRARLESAHASLQSGSDERRAHDAQRAAEAAEHLYLRNVLLRWMENDPEDHEALFPVVAMCLKFTSEEVAAIHTRRERRMRERRGVAWRWFGS